MFFVKNIFSKFISFGITPQMEDNKKIAIQISNFDGVATLLAFCFYYIYGMHAKNTFISYCQLSAIFLSIYGIYLISAHWYDTGRILIFFVGLLGTFLTIDGVSKNSGFEFYYFVNIIIPFISFTPDELKKSVFLAVSGLFFFFIQYLTGPGLLSEVIQITSTDRFFTFAILFVYVIALFSISRWQMHKAQLKIKMQQSELIHISNMATLAEMSGGIAHEINNPLQIISTHISFIKKQFVEIEKIPEKVLKSLEQMEETVMRISKLVKSLKNLSRNVSLDTPVTFSISNAIDDMLSVSSQKLKHLKINLVIEGDTSIEVHAHIVQLSQVFINLINNAIDAIDKLDEKWIKIDIANNVNKKNIIIFTDSGKGISKEVAQKIMLPFFTTKDPGKGTGLGLSISNGMIEKMGGRFYYDSKSMNTKFVIELPTV